MASPEAVDRAREWLLEMQASVRSIDYARARPLFAEDVVAFGTFAAVISGRERLEREQWRRIWPTIRDFTFRLEQLHCLGSDDALCVVVPWDSVGQREHGQAFDRPGRATLVLTVRGERLIATHSHFSLAPTGDDSGTAATHIDEAAARRGSGGRRAGARPLLDERAARE